MKISAKRERATILLIDEDAEFLMAAARRLKKLGYHVTPVRSAQEAARLADQTHPQFILLDRGLPGDGAAARRILAELKRDPAVSRIPVLMTSARQQRLP